MITPIASELQVLAKDSVPLWFFGESKGMRVEEGIAKKEGNTFVGEVNHFSWWSYEETLDFITVKGRLIDSKTLNPIIRAPLYVRTSLYNNTFMTDSTGSFTFRIPRKTTGSIYLECDETVAVGGYRSMYGSYELKISLKRESSGQLNFFDQNGNLIDRKSITLVSNQDLFFDFSMKDEIVFTGIVVDCNNIPMTNGNVTISSSIVNTCLVIKDGVYSLSKIYACENIETTLTVRNYNVSGEITKKVILKLGNNVMPDIQICGSIIDFNYFRYEIDGMKTLVDSGQVAGFIFGNIFSVSEGDSSINGSGFFSTWKSNHYERGTFSIEKGAIMGSKVQSNWESFDIIGTVTKIELVYYEQYFKKNKGTFISMTTDPFSGMEHNIKEDFLYSRKNISPS